MADTAAFPLDLTDVINPTDWRFKTQADVQAWFADHGEAVATARGTLVQAIEAYAAVLKQTGAPERRDFSVERFLNDVMSKADGQLADEVQCWLGV